MLHIFSVKFLPHPILILLLLGTFILTSAPEPTSDKIHLNEQIKCLLHPQAILPDNFLIALLLSGAIFTFICFSTLIRLCLCRLFFYSP